MSSGFLGIRARSRDGLLTEDCAADIDTGRALSEKIALGLAQKGVRSAVVRFAPTVHGGDLQPQSFIRQMTSAAKKHGFSAYVGDGSARWPAVNVLDAAVLLRLILENGPGGLVYHAVADKGNTQYDIASAIGEYLSIPVRSIAVGHEATAHFGFLGAFMTRDSPTSSEETRRSTGWNPTRPSMLVELKAGNPAYY